MELQWAHIYSGVEIMKVSLGLHCGRGYATGCIIHRKLVPKVQVVGAIAGIGVPAGLGHGVGVELGATTRDQSLSSAGFGNCVSYDSNLQCPDVCSLNYVWKDTHTHNTQT